MNPGNIQQPTSKACPRFAECNSAIQQIANLRYALRSQDTSPNLRPRPLRRPAPPGTPRFPLRLPAERSRTNSHLKGGKNIARGNVLGIAPPRSPSPERAKQGSSPRLGAPSHCVSALAFTALSNRRKVRAKQKGPGLATRPLVKCLGLCP